MNTFGQVLRAMRLGFHWSPKYERWVRISSDGPPYRITVHPEGLVPSLRLQKGEFHVAWWDNGDAEGTELLDMIEGLARHGNDTFYVDEEGRRT